MTLVPEIGILCTRFIVHTELFVLRSYYHLSIILEVTTGTSIDTKSSRYFQRSLPMHLHGLLIEITLTAWI